MNILNMSISTNNDKQKVINAITSNLSGNWTRNTSAEKTVSQMGDPQFAFYNKKNDATIFFIERDGFFVTTNIVPNSQRELAINKCNEMLFLFEAEVLNSLTSLSYKIEN